MDDETYQELCDIFCEETDLERMVFFYPNRQWEPIIYQTFFLSLGLSLAEEKKIHQ